VLSGIPLCLRETSLAWLQKTGQVKLKNNNCSSISVNYDYKNLLQYLLGELLFPNWRITNNAAEWDGSAAAAAVNHRTCQNMLSHTANCTTRPLHSACHILVNKQRSHTVTKGKRSGVINFVDTAVSQDPCTRISWNNLLQFWNLKAFTSLLTLTYLFKWAEYHCKKMSVGRTLHRNFLNWLRKYTVLVSNICAFNYDANQQQTHAYVLVYLYNIYWNSMLPPAATQC